MNAIQSAAPHAHPLLRRFAIDLAITAGFNTGIALVLTYLVRHESSFLINFVFSMCIGTLAVTFIDGGRLLLWRAEQPPKLPFILLLAASLPAAQYIGNRIAASLLGISLERGSVFDQKNTTTFVFMTLLTSLVITWFFWNRSRVAQLKAHAEQEKARTAAMERQAMQAQLQMLQAQIEPHMLFNTLANLQALIGVDPPRAQHMLDQLIQYLRATLASSRASTTSLAHEFKLMDAYLGLMKVRMGARLQYKLELPDALREVQVPPMLLQPLVENAIKHGLEPKVDGGEIVVRAVREENRLKLSVADTGLGLDAAPENPESTHVGIANIRERLRALYGERADFSLAPNSPSGVIAQMRIPA